MKHASVFRGQRGLIAAVALLSVFVNLLVLTAPLYMLQLFGRVLSSGSEATLIALSLTALLALGFFFAFEALRQRLITRLGVRIEASLSRRLFADLLRRPAVGTQPLRDLQEVRGFVSGPAFTSLLDAPWALVFILVIWILHPVLGLIAAVGVLTLFGLGVVGELTSRGHSRFALAATQKSNEAADEYLRNAEIFRSMGRVEALASRWDSRARLALASGALANDRITLMTSLAKFVRMALQIAIMGTGAALALQGEVAPGAMIAASILLGRAAAPVEQSIAAWRSLTGARLAKRRLEELLAATETEDDPIELPAPHGRVSIEHATVVLPERQDPVLFDVSLELAPGQSLGLVGPSGAGKTTLARALCGLQPLSRGWIRIDGAALGDWPEEQIGRHIGFLPQRVELLQGTVADNIAGLDPSMTAADVVEAARRANIHELILGLPGGYNAEVGPRGEHLSAGQRQLVGLARAMAGERRLIVLDEPNSNLDPDGEAALADAVRRACERGCVVVVITHRMNILAQLTHAALLRDGRLVVHGAARDVLRRIGRPVAVGRDGEAASRLADRREAADMAQEG